jgi:hypothetical protein
VSLHPYKLDGMFFITKIISPGAPKAVGAGAGAPKREGAGAGLPKGSGLGAEGYESEMILFMSTHGNFTSTTNYIFYSPAPNKPLDAGAGALPNRPTDGAEYHDK